MDTPPTKERKLAGDDEANRNNQGAKRATGAFANLLLIFLSPELPCALHDLTLLADPSFFNKLVWTGSLFLASRRVLTNVANIVMIYQGVPCKWVKLLIKHV